MAIPKPSETSLPAQPAPPAPARFSTHLMKRTLALALACLLAVSSARADLGGVEVSTDFDAEFARAADLLEEGKRAEAEQILDAIRRKAGQPAWDARVTLLLAADDARRHDDVAAANRLRDVSAAVIGLDAYRLLLRAQALERAGDTEDAIEAARLAFEVEGPFAFRVRAGITLSGLLEKRHHAREAAAVLALAAETAVTSDETAEVALARIRLGLAAGDAAAVRSAAHDLLLAAPTADARKDTPAYARRAAQEEEARLTAAERGRRGSALVAVGDPRRGVRLLLQDRPSAWPEGERSQNLLALARGQLALKKAKVAEATAALVPEDTTAASYQARLFRCDRIVARVERKGSTTIDPNDPRLAPVRLALEGLTDPAVPEAARRGAHERLLRMDADSGNFDGAVEHARELTRGASGSIEGFDPLWKLAWSPYASGDYAVARERMEVLATVYADISRSRRLAYWRARCLAAGGREAEARAIYEALAVSVPADLYARWARAQAPNAPAVERAVLPDPSTATAGFARVDELLRLRMFEEAVAEGRTLLPSRGRDLRIAQADFALGRFLAAAAAIKRAIPEIGTAEEGRVPDGWRRLYYPIENGGFLAERAREADVDAAVLRGLVRQESVFDASAKSHAGAMGLTQLMPATAKSLSRSVLRSRYRSAFLYDPGVNAKLGAAYLKQLLDQFNGSQVLALAAYNGGPTRMARLVRESPGKSEDEIYESIPFYETRDYVRRVLLYAESYRELYP
jgi:soluble lytic murein transglycosylase-like protein